MTDLFTEIFPIAPDAVPALTAYALDFGDSPPAPTGGRLAHYLTRTSAGRWIWAGERLLTDTPITEVEAEIAVDILRGEQPEQYGELLAIVEIDHPLTPRDQADYLLRTRLRDLEAEIDASLAHTTIQSGDIRIERIPRLRAWAVDGLPALSISIQSRLIYKHDLRSVAETLDKPKQMVGLWVMDKQSGMVGEIVRVVGKAGKQREKLLKVAKRSAMQTIIREADDDEPVVRVLSARGEIDYVAGALHVLIRPDSRADIQRFKLDAEQVVRTVRLKPASRAALVKCVSDVLKEAGLIESAYNARTHPNNFSAVSPGVSLQFDSNRVRRYNRESLANDFIQCGVYNRRNVFQDGAIRIATINTLGEKLDDFIEAMRRQLERQFEFTIELIRERKVKKVSNRMLDSAVKVTAKENPHIILAFFPDAAEIEGSEDEDYRLVKSLTLGRGIASHVIRRSTIDQPEAMATVIMGLLGKTGNTPFALADPLDYTEYVVGMDMVQQHKKDGVHVTAIARIYKRDGQLLRYILHRITLEEGEAIPFIIMQTLFPMEVFGGKRVIIHRDGMFSEDERELLTRWAKVLGATFYPVEIMKRSAPRLYTLEKGVSSPPWSSAFKLSAAEALLVTSAAREESPRPLHIRIEKDTLTIEQALHSVLVWTLLHYGALRPPQLPVTIAYADELSRWLEKGTLPSGTEGDVPFWL